MHVVPAYYFEPLLSRIHRRVRYNRDACGVSLLLRTLAGPQLYVEFSTTTMRGVSACYSELLLDRSCMPSSVQPLCMWCQLITPNPCWTAFTAESGTTAMHVVSAYYFEPLLDRSCTPSPVQPRCNACVSAYYFEPSLDRSCTLSSVQPRCMWCQLITLNP
jgi:hypothetical protein